MLKYQLYRLLCRKKKVKDQFYYVKVRKDPDPVFSRRSDPDPVLYKGLDPDKTL